MRMTNKANKNLRIENKRLKVCHDVCIYEIFKRKTKPTTTKAIQNLSVSEVLTLRGKG